MRVGGAAHVHLIGPTREVSGPGAHERARVRVASTRSEQFRMQFD